MKNRLQLEEITMSETIMSEAEKLLAEIYNDKYYPPVEGITKGCEAYFPCCDIAAYFSERGVYKEEGEDYYLYKREESDE